jgi:hypothetical protein
VAWLTVPTSPYTRNDVVGVNAHAAHNDTIADHRSSPIIADY